MLAKILTVSGLVSASLLFIVLTTTTPSQSGAFGILAIFILTYVVLLTIITFFIRGLSALMGRLGRSDARSSKMFMGLKKAYYYASVIALAPVIIISLESVGGIGVYELCLVVLFVVVGCVYVSRRTV